MKKPLFFILLLSIFSCKQPNNLGLFNKRNVSNLKIINIDSLEYQQRYNIDKYIEKVVHIKLENNNSFVGSYDKIIKKGDSIFIADYKFAKAVFCFNIKGEFLFKISHLGGGPNEYKDITDFIVDSKNNRIGILDPARNIIKLYSMSNQNYIKSLTFLDKQTIASRIEFNNNQYFVTRNNECTYTDFNCYNFSVFDFSGNLVYEDLPINIYLKNYTFNKPRYFSTNLNSTYYNSVFNDTIYSYNKNIFKAEYYVDFGKHKLQDNIKYSKDNDISKIIFEDCIKNDLTWGIDFFAITDNMVSLLYTSGKNTFNVFYNPKTNKGIKFNGFLSNKYHLSTVQYSSDNYFISVTSLESLLNFKKHYLGADEKFKLDNKLMYEVIKDLSINDNNLITLFKLKDFE